MKRQRSETITVLTQDEQDWTSTEKGFIGKLFEARKYHGGDWWLAAISLAGLIFFLILALFPGVFAPYDYNDEAGPSEIGPLEEPAEFVAIARSDAGYSDIESIDDDLERASDAPRVGSTNDIASRVVGTLRQDLGVTLRPVRLQREITNISPEQAMEQVQTGEVDVLVGDEEIYLALLDEFPELESLGNVGRTYDRPFYFGTNELGQDMFSRLIWGTRITLVIGLTSALFSSLIGIPIGLLSGFFGGSLDRVLTLIMDSLYSFPGLILAIAIAAVLGPSIGNIILAIAVLYIPTYFRVVRGQTLAVKESLYVEAARSLGANRIVILFRYVFPNVIASVVVIFSVNVADAILTGAGLSFLGLGIEENLAEWGVDLARGQEQFQTSWWLVTFPGLAIAILTLCFSLLGESLSEILNPKLNKS